MAHWVKLLLLKPDDVNAIPATHVKVEGEN